MRILVPGADGQVGKQLILFGAVANHEVIAVNRNELDITKTDDVKNIVSDINPHIVVNAAAYTAVDKAESEEDIAYAVNRDGPANLAKACAEQQIPLIHISTDYVFDGTKQGPYQETDQVNPTSIYGKSKEAGESAIRERLDQHIILRTSWVFSADGGNFVKTMLRLASERDHLRIVADQHGGPTSAASIAKACLNIADQVVSKEQASFGTYHFSGTAPTTWYDFAKEIFAKASEKTGKQPSVDPITTEEYPTPAIRPQNSVLACDKVLNNFGIEQPSWQNDLETVLNILIE